MKPAVFLDRDGTVVRHVHYLANPADVELLDGVVDGLRKLHDLGFRLVLVTNQSVIGRGILSEAGYGRVHTELCRQLRLGGVELDGHYYCPVVPLGDDRTVIEHEDRKPGPGMLRRAARELGLDVASSWMVGDMISDVLAGRNAGCRTILLADPARMAQNGAQQLSHHVARDVAEAAEIIARFSC